MSLDVTLIEGHEEPTTRWCDYCGVEHQCAPELVVYDANITHNLNRMAKEAGIYEACWRPEEIGATHARDLIPLLRRGLRKLVEDPEHFKQFNASNGWGLYEHFVTWVSEYLRACEEHPYATIRVSR